DEWLVFPLTYRDLPRDAALHLTLWTSLCLSDADAYTPRRRADDGEDDHPDAMPRVRPIACARFPLFGKHATLRKGRHKVPLAAVPSGRSAMTTAAAPDPDLIAQLEKRMRRYARGDLPRVAWLDRIVFREMERVYTAQTQAAADAVQAIRDAGGDVAALPRGGMLAYLHIEVPQFDLPVVGGGAMVGASGTSGGSTARGAAGLGMTDPDEDWNPIEAKHRKLVRSDRRGYGPLDRELKPNAQARDALQTIIRYPPHQELSSEEKDLVWKFRMHLTRDKKALTKFLRSVTWSDPGEVRQALELLPYWVAIDVEDALELLSAEFNTHPEQHAAVRAFAVQQLRHADDNDLQLFLLQLVQALRHERVFSHHPSTPASADPFSSTPLIDFIVERSVQNRSLGNAFYWYVTAKEAALAAKTYGRVAYQFQTALMDQPDGYHRREIFRRQGELVAKLYALADSLQRSKSPRGAKIEQLRAHIADARNGLLSFAPLPLPLDADVHVTGIRPEKCSIFKSAMLPLCLMFTTVDGAEYPIMFKAGDDLRQDQLVLQFIRLFDRLLRRENLDLKVTPYKVLATGVKHGMVQLVLPSVSIGSIMREGPANILTRATPAATPAAAWQDPMLLAQETYAKSLAGYTVMTFILGVGDRHLDNILIQPDGHLFHIDFGFILGRDPKPYPPPVRLTQEMMDALPGGENPYRRMPYALFLRDCCVAYTILRKSANLILNLVSLLTHMNVPGIAIEPDQAVAKVQAKLRTDLTDEEEASAFLVSIIQQSFESLLPSMLEHIHNLAQLLRS
ncbi:hypothetical protein CXG81DRAFT_11220, partial [Caulochytrium protostelioides]